MGGERSPGGIPILRHEAKQRGFTPARPGAHVEEVEEHIARHFGTPATVFHEIASDLVHIDVHAVPPEPGRDFWTLFTSGMSDLPMTVPEGLAELARAELLIKLPASWGIEDLKTTPPEPDLERWYWPIRELKQLARLPHEYETWVGFGHTIPNGDPPEPFASRTSLCAWLLLPPLDMPPEASSFSVRDGSVVNLYFMHALHRDELELKLVRGTDALLDRFDDAGFSDVLDPTRPSVVRRKGFGLLRRK